ncbi:YbaK/EbsC family protein [Amnibacterium endophyticum]|uniref:YbaK/EbsC family protein n=1 Tax=Amnibacterium endophyticum TaxID=2109337 RepID=A0ABW4LFN3_9MICO
MTSFVLGGLDGTAAGERPDLLAAPVLDALTALGLLEAVGVVPIDPAISDTAATQEAYGLEAASLVNCVLVGGARGGDQRVAACLVPADRRADVNGFVRRRLDVRKASFLPREQAVESSGMEFGGITAFGLPAGWPVLVAAAAVAQPLVVVGSGVRRSKLLVPGGLLARIPGAEVADGVAP